MRANLHIALVAGEASGDQLGAALIRELKTIYPDAVFSGIGGQSMKTQGFNVWWDCDELAVMGLTEVLSQLPRLLRLRKSLRQRLLELKPDIYIGIDAPDFNLPVERTLREAGITTVQYVSPTVWAWRQGRVKGIARSADLVMCLFPFEPDFYHAHDVAAEYTGHPMADEIDEVDDPSPARDQLGLDSKGPVIALLPGSRRSEAELLSPHLLGAASLLAKRDPATRFIAPMARPRVKVEFEKAMTEFPDVECKLIDGQARLAISAADLVLCASGTAALETMLINRPMVVVYRFSHVTYAIGKILQLVKSRFFSLPNILAGEELVPELGQYAGNAERIATEATAWLDDPERCTRVRSQFSMLHDKLRKNAARAAAHCIKPLLEKQQ
jgi:lipid-A-disaccharide synthase